MTLLCHCVFKSEKITSVEGKDNLIFVIVHCSVCYVISGSSSVWLVIFDFINYSCLLIRMEIDDICYTLKYARVCHRTK